MRKFIAVGAAAALAVLASGEAKAQVISLGFGNGGLYSPYSGFGGYPGYGYGGSGFSLSFGNSPYRSAYYGGGYRPYYGGYRPSYGYGNTGGYRSYGGGYYGGYNSGRGWRR